MIPAASSTAASKRARSSAAVRSSSQRALKPDDAVDTHRARTPSINDSVIRWPVSLASTDCTSVSSTTAATSSSPSQIRAPNSRHTPEGGVADAVGPDLVELPLVVVEVPGRRLEAEADVDPQVGTGEQLRITGADDLHRFRQEAECGDGEDLVGVEGAVVRGDSHRRIMTARGLTPSGR